MAEWVSHLIVADKVLEKFPQLSRHEFCVGNIAPDCNIPIGYPPSLMLSLVLCHFTKVSVVHKGKRKGTNRPVGGTACPVDMRLAQTETECRLALC